MLVSYDTRTSAPSSLKRIKRPPLGRAGVRRREHAQLAAALAVAAQRIEQRRDAAPADERHHEVDAIGRMEFGEELVADPRFARSVREQRRVEQRDERLRHRSRAVRPESGPARHAGRRLVQSALRVRHRRSADRRVDLVNQLPRKRDSDRNTLEHHPRR